MKKLFLAFALVTLVASVGAATLAPDVAAGYGQVMALTNGSGDLTTGTLIGPNTFVTTAGLAIDIGVCADMHNWHRCDLPVPPGFCDGLVSLEAHGWEPGSMWADPLDVWDSNCEG